MRLSARVDYALRAMVQLAAAQATLDPERRVSANELAEAEKISRKFLDDILRQLCHRGMITSVRGPRGGYQLAQPADQISVADVIRVVDGPLAQIRGHRPEELGYRGAATALRDVWVALRCVERDILERVSIGQIARGELPPDIGRLAADPGVWT